MRYYSQYKQDYFVNLLFHGKSKGIFLDFGAHDGITFSNSCFFEKEKNWTGICIEPIPEVFDKLKNNRSCTCLNCAISDTEETTKFIKCSGYVEM